MSPRKGAHNLDRLITLGEVQEMMNRQAAIFSAVVFRLRQCERKLGITAEEPVQ